ncbi:lantibiotic dehydratase [Olivibacter jilunii]|uniref:lantibiotic dehydratase n=1 Tax=Olivibacter jilunii TaxID=985016 RepID=UPI003F188739
MANDIEPFDFLMLRAPSLPLDEIHKVNTVSGFDSLAVMLKDLLANYPEIIEAISIANDQISLTFHDWLEGKSDLSEKLLLTLYRYVARMSTRATPFGRFSGVCIGNIGEKPNSFILSGKYVVKGRLSMDYLAAKIQPILREPSLLSRLKLYPNSSIQDFGDHFRFARHKTLNDRRHYSWIRINKNPLIETVYKRTREGVTFGKLKSFLTGFQIDAGKVSDYLTDLVENQFLVSELEPSVTGSKYFDILSRKIGNYGGEAKSLKDQIQLAKQYNGDHIPDDDRRDLLSSACKRNMQKVQVDKKFIPAALNLNRASVEIIAREIAEISPLFKTGIPDDLRAFADNFTKRYDLKEVPLLEALDGDLGIGYGDLSEQYRDENPLIKDLGISTNSLNDEKDIRDRVFSELLDDRTPEIALESLNLENLKHRNDSHRFPSTFYALGNIITMNCSALDRGDFRFNLAACCGPSALNLMSRFGYMDRKLTAKLKFCAEYEERKFSDAIIAEIVHIPEDKTGNILQRPIMHTYEIPFLGNSGVDQSHQIQLNDILVSVREGKVVLRSKSLDKRIVPRLSCAHNFRTGVSIYRFLCDLQYQDHPFSLRWNWGKFEGYTYLPRITFKHLILSRRRWFITRRDLSEDERQELIDELRDRYGFPDEVIVAEGDNELYLNLNTEWGLQLFFDKLRKGDLILYEFLFGKDGLLKDKHGKSYTHEVIIPFKSSYMDNLKTHFPIAEDKVKRDFPPGSEWTYLKLYCPQKSADELIAKNINALIERLENEKLISKWFFVRYNDPDFHIRIRFLSNGNKTAISLIFAFIQEELNPLVEQKRVWKMQYDTYVREVERYGVDNMELSESVFHQDSISVLHLLRNISLSDHQTRWKFALVGVDQLFMLLEVDLPMRLKWVDEWSLSFQKEFNVDKQQQKKLNLGFRSHQNEIEKAFENRDEWLCRILDERMNGLRETLKVLKDKSTTSKRKILGSLCHMFLNRVFFSDQRANEMVVYHYLAKYYLSVIGKTNRLKYIQNREIENII